MIILLFVLSLILTFICIYFAENSNIVDDLCYIGAIFSGLFCFTSFIALIVLCVIVSKGRVINQRIDMYQEQNNQIENSISDLVENYMDYESKTFKDLSPDSSITLISLYPELKSDKLVEQQCNLYMENNKKITELRESQINLTLYKWWLNFGK